MSPAARTAMKSAPAVASCSGLRRCFDVEGDNGHLEDFGPPLDEVVSAGDGCIPVGDVSRNSEADVVGSLLTEQHGVVARASGVDADDAIRPQDLARLFVGSGRILAPGNVDAIGAEGAREMRVSFDQRRDIHFLRDGDERLHSLGI